MFHIFGFILFFIFIILLIGFTILWRIVNTFLGIGRRMGGTANPYTQQGQQGDNRQNSDYQQANSSTNNNQGYSSASSNNKDKQKVFADDEGEYIEFEEIKD